jgi:hypothetical protein
MSGMKFRRTCSVCNATFFSPDRKATHCLKCHKRRVVKHVPTEARVPTPTPRLAPQARELLSEPAGCGSEGETPRSSKAAVLTPECVAELLKHSSRNTRMALFLCAKCTLRSPENSGVKRQLVADVIREITQGKATVAEEQKARANRDVSTVRRKAGTRPEGGRRRAISVRSALHTSR